MVALLALQIVTGASSGADPLAFLQPTVAISADDRRRLDAGEAVARVLPAQEHEIAVWAAVRADIAGDRLVMWMRRIDALKKSSYVVAIGRFSTPPDIADLSDLALDDEELSEFVKCRIGNCGLKLSAAEITQLQHVTEQSRGNSAPALQQAFRQLILQRVNVYLTQGHRALPPIEDRAGQTWLATDFARVLGHSTFLTQHVPQFAAHLSRYPESPLPDVESFVYWSKERIGGKPVVSATHVNVLRSSQPGLPEVLVAGKQIFATHYVNGSLGVTLILRGGGGGPNYLVYVNRSDVDVVGGMFGGLVRWVLQRRVKAEAGNVLLGLKRRLESGEPPIGVVSGR